MNVVHSHHCWMLGVVLFYIIIQISVFSEAVTYRTASSVDLILADIMSAVSETLPLSQHWDGDETLRSTMIDDTDGSEWNEMFMRLRPVCWEKSDLYFHSSCVFLDKRFVLDIEFKIKKHHCIMCEDLFIQSLSYDVDVLALNGKASVMILRCLYPW